MLKSMSRIVLSFTHNRNRFVQTKTTDIEGWPQSVELHEATFFDDISKAQAYARDWPGEFVMEMVVLQLNDRKDGIRL